METRANYVAVGTFVLLGVIAIIAATLWLAGAQYRNEFAFYTVYFTGPVTGLGEGTIVRYNGIEVGNVANLEFDAADPRRVVATLQLDPTLRLRTDSVASIEVQGLAGGSYVEIAGGTATAPVLTARPGEEYPVIPSEPSTLQQLAETGPELLRRLNLIGERLAEFLDDENQEAFAATLVNLRDITATFSGRSGDIDTAIGNLNTATQRFDTVLGSADRMLASTDEAMRKLGQLSDDASGVVNGQAVAQFNQLLAQTSILVESLTQLSNDLQREPTRLLYGDRREGYTPQ